MLTQRGLVEEFATILGVEFEPDPVLFSELDEFLNRLSGAHSRNRMIRHRRLIAQVNRKFRFNAGGVKHFLAFAAKRGVTFNYHEKTCINAAFDESDHSILMQVLDKRTRTGDENWSEFLPVFEPISERKTLERLHAELRSPTLTRKDSKPRDWSEEILSALFGAFVFESYPTQIVHSITGPLSGNQTYHECFWDHLHVNWPGLFNRDNTLTIIDVNQSWMEQTDGYATLRKSLLSMIRHYHEKISNHGHLALLIPRIHDQDGPRQWEMFADAVLFAEKHIMERPERYFFKREQIERATCEHIAQLDAAAADFSLIQRGFHYRDCFVIGREARQYLLVVFQKNVADETLIPCPACRSHNVQGNSYSSFGVRSWECRNQLCPDRSKFNRGKRYSFLQLLKQRAIEEIENQIPSHSVRAWARDVQPERDISQVLEMLVRHYTLHSDTVLGVNLDVGERAIFGRSIRCQKIQELESVELLPVENFYASPFFRRFVVNRAEPALSAPSVVTEIAGVTAICGDSYTILKEIPSNTFDGAVTSPPYYNAREYSKWDNIYTYLYDMYNVNREVYRTLNPGAVYLYNIFDYFDNEHTVALSAMGQKRMILGAYTVDLFRRIGFRCVGNIVWDKGDIEGKRGFNNGNFSPYYQSPFNCWEHVLVLEKPSRNHKPNWCFPTELRQKPVLKMVRGQNVHGHSAPFPEAIPELLISQLDTDASVLDPFAGSMTTGLAAAKHGVRATVVEINPKYFDRFRPAAD